MNILILNGPNLNMIGKREPEIYGTKTYEDLETFTHYSYALYDAIKSIQIPVVEIHLSDINNREDFRKVSVIRDACITNITGLGFQGYEEGIKYLIKEGVKNDC